MIVTKENDNKEFADNGSEKDLNSINKKCRQLGVSKDKITIPDEFDEWDKEIEQMFNFQ